MKSINATLLGGTIGFVFGSIVIIPITNLQNGENRYPFIRDRIESYGVTTLEYQLDKNGTKMNLDLILDEKNYYTYRTLNEKNLSPLIFEINFYNNGEYLKDFHASLNESDISSGTIEKIFFDYCQGDIENVFKAFNQYEDNNYETYLFSDWDYNATLTRTYIDYNDIKSVYESKSDNKKDTDDFIKGITLFVFTGSYGTYYMNKIEQTNKKYLRKK